MAADPELAIQDILQENGTGLAYLSMTSIF